MTNKKIQISIEVLDQFSQIMLNVNLAQAEGKIFSLDSLKQNDALKKYLNNKIGDQLRRSIYLCDCDKLRPKHEPHLQEKDLITIFRATLRHNGYQLMSSNDRNSATKPRIYYISASKMLAKNT